jgi:ATP-dependent exoDNAse (exonuclease V) beta subunit
MPPTYLASLNPHERDKRITFQEEGHIYKIEGVAEKPISVTTLIHSFFPEFDADTVIDKMMAGRKWSESKYFGKTKQEIKNEWEISRDQAAKSGTMMHADIERFLNKEPVLDPNSPEHRYFQAFWSGFQQVNPSYQPYRTEWLVFDEDKKLAGSIDCVLSNPAGEIVILDWKRSKEIKKSNFFEKGLGPLSNLDNCNFHHYTLQLNIYRHVLETRYGKRVMAMYIVVCHPTNPSFQVHVIERFDIASIWDQLFQISPNFGIASTRHHKATASEE